MPIAWGNTTVETAAAFTLPGGPGDVVRVSIANVEPIPVAQRTGALIGFVGNHSDPPDDNGNLSVTVTWTGTDADQDPTQPDGVHFIKSCIGQAGGFGPIPAGLFATEFTATLYVTDSPGHSLGLPMYVTTQSTSAEPDSAHLPETDPPSGADALNPPVSVSALGDASLTLTWEDHSDNEIGFGIEVRDVLAGGGALDPDRIDPATVGAFPQTAAVWRAWDAVSANRTGYVLPETDVAYLHLRDIPPDQAIVRIYAWHRTKQSAFAYFRATPVLRLTTTIPQRGGMLGGERVIVVGTAFRDGATVTFGGLPATTVVWLSDTELGVDTPAHAEGVVAVAVTNPDGATAALAAAFTYLSYVTTPVPIAGGLQTAHGPRPSTITTAARIVRGANNGVITYAWVAAPENPAPTTFGSPTALNTTITFDTYVPGRYRFTLTARDAGGLFAGQDELVVVVPAPTPPIIRIAAPRPVGV